MNNQMNSLFEKYEAELGGFGFEAGPEPRDEGTEAEGTEAYTLEELAVNPEAQLFVFKNCLIKAGCSIETACGISGLPFGTAVQLIGASACATSGVDFVEGGPGNNPELVPFKEAARQAVALRNAKLQESMFLAATQGSTETTVTETPDGITTRTVSRPPDAGMALKLMQQYDPNNYNQARVEPKQDNAGEVTKIEIVERTKDQPKPPPSKPLGGNGV